MSPAYKLIQALYHPTCTLNAPSHAHNRTPGV